MNSSTKPDNPEACASCRITDDFERIRYSPVFSGLNLDVVRLFAYLSPHRSIKKGNYLTIQGQKADKAFIINGSVEITVEYKGKLIPLQKLGEDSSFGELALLAQFDCFFNSRAVEDSDIIVIDRNTFQKALEKYPEYKDKLIERIVQLRVDRLVHQTSFILDQILETCDEAEMLL